MLYGAYRLLTNAAGPFIPRWLDLRARRGKEDPARLNERRGQAVMPRPAGRLVWFHAASIGEALSILPLVDAAASQSWNVLVTTGTVIPDGSLVLGSPAKAVRQLTDDEIANMHRGIKTYIDRAARFRKELKAIDAND